MSRTGKKLKLGAVLEISRHNSWILLLHQTRGLFFWRWRLESLEAETGPLQTRGR